MTQTGPLLLAEEKTEVFGRPRFYKRQASGGGKYQMVIMSASTRKRGIYLKENSQGQGRKDSFIFVKEKSTEVGSNVEVPGLRQGKEPRICQKIGESRALEAWVETSTRESNQQGTRILELGVHSLSTAKN